MLIIAFTSDRGLCAMIARTLKFFFVFLGYRKDVHSVLADASKDTRQT